MDLKTAKQELESYGDIKFYYDNMKKSVNSLYHVSVSKEVAAGSRKQLELDRLTDEMRTLEESLTVKIAKINSPHNAILYDRFLSLMKPNELCRKFSYSPQHIRRLIDQGIAKYAALSET